MRHGGQNLMQPAYMRIPLAQLIEMLQDRVEEDPNYQIDLLVTGHILQFTKAPPQPTLH